MPLIVGFRGHSGVGKDTSNVLLKQVLASKSITHGSAAIAAKIKQIAHTLYSHYGVQHPAYYDVNRQERYEKLPLIDKTPVEIWCDLGDSILDRVYKNTWVDQALLQAEESRCDVFCLTDVRYPWEIEAIRRDGGVIVNVINPRAKPLSSRADHALDNWDGVYDYDLHNDGSQTDLENKVYRLSKQLISRRSSKLSQSH